MKKIFSIILFMCCLVLFTGCFNTDYVIILQYNNSQDEVQTINIHQNQEMPKLEKLERKWYIFKGWYSTKDGEEFIVHDGTRYVVDQGLFKHKTYDVSSNEVIIYAKFEFEDINCFVNVKTNISTVPDQSHTVKYGHELPQLSLLNKEHYDFQGWYTIYNGEEILINNGSSYLHGYANLLDTCYEINNFSIEIFAKFTIELIPITFKYEVNGVDKEEVINVPYMNKLKDSGPQELNEYGEMSGFCWGLSADTSLIDEVIVATEPITVYAIGRYTKYNNQYSAIKSLDNKELLVDFRTSSANINSVYTVESGITKIIFVGNPNITYTNFSIIVSASFSIVEFTLVDFKYTAPNGKVGLDASNLSNNSTLIINAKGNCEIKGGDGTNGKDGDSYNINKSTKTPRSGTVGVSGSNGLQALIANNIEINIDLNGALKLVGGSGGNGGIGGNGEGSASDGIAKCGDGADGGNGGNGANALEILYNLKLNSEGNLILVGGNAGNGGNGGSGGNNQDTGMFDRADHGGHGANGGNGGIGGIGLYVHNNANVEVIKSNTISVTGGNGGIGGNGGNGGKSCKNEFQTGNGGNPGDAGSGGAGGSGGNSIVGIELEVIKNGGKGNHGGSAGAPGSADGKIGKSGENRLSIYAPDGI